MNRAVLEPGSDGDQRERDPAPRKLNNQKETNMSLHKTSHTGTPAPSELVPSRYAVRIGEIEVLVVSDGVLPLPTKMLGHNIDQAVRTAWLNDMFLPPDAFDWSLNEIVVRSSGQTILIDAGLGLDPNLNLPRAGQLIKRLEAAGIDLASVTDVVLTHMHMDHVGGLLVDGVKEPAASGPADPRGGRRGQILGFARLHTRLHAAGIPGCASRQPLGGSRKNTAAICGCSRTSTRWRRG